MALDKSNIIDAVGIDKSSGEVVLTIADQLPWNETGHLSALQEKVNRYLGFIEQGELLESYPESKDKPVRIDIIFRYEPPAEVVSLLNAAASVVHTYGCKFSWRLHAA